MVMTKKTYLLGGSIVLILVISLLTVVVNHKLNNRTTNDGMTSENFDRTISGVRSMLESVVNGRIDEGKIAYNTVSDFFPEIASKLKVKNPELAAQLKDTVSLIEEQFGKQEADQFLLLKYGSELTNLIKEAKVQLVE